MIQISQLKFKPGYTIDDVKAKSASILKIFPEDIISISIDKESIDARKKPDIFMVLTVLLKIKHEDNILNRCKSVQVSKYIEKKYMPKVDGTERLINRPIIVGAGPAGLFAAYFLTKYGYKPLVLERGFDVDSRTKDVENFFETGILNPNSNVIFGEGGAGTFSDGKLNTLVKDKDGRNKEVLNIFVKYGANPNILYSNKPHIGTDVLVKVIKNMREDIKAHGGEFRFNAEVTDIEIKDGRINGVIINGFSKEPCDILVLAIGHSARNTFSMLYEKGVHMEQKEFAVGLRVEHRQKMIDNALYSTDEKVLKLLPAAPYKVAARTSFDRGVYSFCMCPGGYVVNASSEKGYLCVNGMSYSDRAGVNANSAIVISVKKEDFGSDHPLAGIDFQRQLEKKAFEIGNGSIPVQYYIDFKCDTEGTVNLSDKDVSLLFAYGPEMKGAYSFSKVSEIMPEEFNKAFIEGMEQFNNIIPGFADDYTLLSGIESRTSSPVRINRKENFESINVNGLYPAGEGAGYAGGIMSAAMDGMKVFEAISSKYKPICE